MGGRSYGLGLQPRCCPPPVECLLVRLLSCFVLAVLSALTTSRVASFLLDSLPAPPPLAIIQPAAIFFFFFPPFLVPPALPRFPKLSLRFAASRMVPDSPTHLVMRMVATGFFIAADATVIPHMGSCCCTCCALTLTLVHVAVLAVPRPCG